MNVDEISEGLDLLAEDTRSIRSGFEAWAMSVGIVADDRFYELVERLDSLASTIEAINHDMEF